MLKGFKEFILKGNVIELATAVIIGAAFTAIVTAFTSKVIQPLINAIPGGGKNPTQGLGFQITDKTSTFVDIGAVVSTVINFLIVAAVVYFLIIMPYNKLSELGGYSSKMQVTEVALLTEIRDILDPGGSSKAREEATRDLPDHLADPGETSGQGRAPGTAQRPTSDTSAGSPQTGPTAPYPTPPPAPGAYPPPGNYPPDDFPPAEGPGRHSR